MSAVILNIDIEQNASFDLTINLTDSSNGQPIDISAWSFTGSIRTAYENPDTEVFFTITPLPSASSAVASLTGADTWLLKNSAYVYDIIANDHSQSPIYTRRLLAGRVKIDKGVTQP